MNTITGLAQVRNSSKIIPEKGNLACLCHSASIDRDYSLGISILKKQFGRRLVKIFGPQHGIVGDVQDNMVETKHSHHPFFDLPIFSLYSETRIPTDEMLEGVDIMIIDLQDVGTRVYTYISTMGAVMEACGKKDIEVVILDRPNPIGGIQVEGNILEKSFQSFVGRYEIPMRHGMTMGEMALFGQKYSGEDCSLKIIPLKNWHRQYFDETGLPWVPPSPNLPVFEGSCTFPGTVLLEGTNLSEGRGTTRSLEMIGHPDIEPHAFKEEMEPLLKQHGLEGLILRPVVFRPTFQKHAGQTCGGFHIHVIDKKKFRPWHFGQVLIQAFSKKLGEKFSWAPPPYEYEYDKLPMDLINGSDKIRRWVENDGDRETLLNLEMKNFDVFMDKRESCLLYNKENS